MANYSTTKTPTKVWVNGRVIGEVCSGIFYKRIKSSHILNKPRAIAFDLLSLDDAERAGAKSVCVTNTDTDDIYRAETAIIRAKGFPVNRGYGSQIALELKHWQTTDRDGNAIPQRSGNPPPGQLGAVFAVEVEAVTQLSLLEVGV